LTHRKSSAHLIEIETSVAAVIELLSGLQHLNYFMRQTAQARSSSASTKGESRFMKMQRSRVNISCNFL